MINDLVFESLLDRKLEAGMQQGQHLDALWPNHNTNIGHMLQQRELQQISQMQQAQQMQNAQQMENARFAQTSQDARLLQQNRQNEQMQQMQMNSFVQMPKKTDARTARLKNKLLDVRDRLLGVNKPII